MAFSIIKWYPSLVAEHYDPEIKMDKLKYFPHYLEQECSDIYINVKITFEERDSAQTKEEATSQIIIKTLKK